MWGGGGAAGAGGGRSSPRAFHLHAHDPKIILYRGANGEREGGENRVGTLAIGRVGKRGERERERKGERVGLPFRPRARGGFNRELCCLLGSTIGGSAA